MSQVHDDLHAFYAEQTRRERLRRERLELAKSIAVFLLVAGGLIALCWPVWKAAQTIH